MIVQTPTNWPNTPIKTIQLQHGFFCIVDPELYDLLSSYRWYAKKSFHCFYPCRKIIVSGKQKIVRMHRIIAETPPDMVCHHINGNTFDERRLNLQNISEYEHAKYYSYR